MSKSAESDLSRINLLDDPKTIQNKIKRAKTDAWDGLELDNPERPESTNLLGIYSLCTGMSMVRCTSSSCIDIPVSVSLSSSSTNVSCQEGPAR